jgi:hypothetical protein
MQYPSPGVSLSVPGLKGSILRPGTQCMHPCISPVFKSADSAFEHPTRAIQGQRSGASRDSPVAGEGVERGTWERRERGTRNMGTARARRRMQWSAVTCCSANPIRSAGARTQVVPRRPYHQCSTGRRLRHCRRLHWASARHTTIWLTFSDTWDSGLSSPLRVASSDWNRAMTQGIDTSHRDLGLNVSSNRISNNNAID